MKQQNKGPQGLLVKDVSPGLTLALLQPRGESLSPALEEEAEEWMRQEMVGEDPGKLVFWIQSRTRPPFSAICFVIQ